MDEIDVKILKLLQHDCNLPASEIAEKVGLSTSPCWKRISKLREKDIIKRQVSILNAAKLGFGLTAYVSIKTGEHSG